jgi:hypothetical protein
MVRRTAGSIWDEQTVTDGSSSVHVILVLSAGSKSPEIKTMKIPKLLSYVAKVGGACFAAVCGTISFWLKQHDADFGQQAKGNKAGGKH